MIKAHYALWARYYEHDERETRFAMVSVPQFCHDIGLKKHVKGGYRPEQKREAMKLLEVLANIQLLAEKTLPNKKRVRLRGPLWSRGIDAEMRDAYGDLFGHGREGSPEQWEPISFSFAPGPFFDNPDWRRYHRYIGRIGAGLLRLSTDTDEWAILIGGYLAVLGRVNQYQPIHIKIGTLLKSVGLAQSEDAQRRAKVWQERLWKALDRLSASDIGVVQSWRLLGIEEGRDPAEDDADDVNAWAEHGAQEVYPTGDWRNWKVEIVLPFESEGQQLQKAQTKAIQAQANQAQANQAQTPAKKPLETPKPRIQQPSLLDSAEQETPHPDSA